MDQQQWASVGLPPLSRVRLDELLRELLDRASEVMAGRERLRNLLDAAVGIGADPDLRSTLERIVVVVSCQLTDAATADRVVGSDRRRSEFITHTSRSSAAFVPQGAGMGGAGPCPQRRRPRAPAPTKAAGSR